MITLGIDPGTKNAAYSVLNNAEVIDLGFIQHPITDLTKNVKNQSKLFKAEVQSIIRRNKVELIVVERFMARNKVQGATGEKVSIMIGVLLTLKPHQLIITPAQWKNALNKKQSLEEVYEYTTKLTHHEIDATFIAYYGLDLQSGRKPFNALSATFSKQLKQWS